MVSIEDSLCVCLPDSTLPVFLHPVQIVCGRKFVKLAKGDHKVIRLLSNQSSSSERGLTKTSVIEDLIALRNQKRNELLHHRSDEDQRRESLGIDSAPHPKRNKVSEASLPESIQLRVPAVGDAGSTDIRVLMAKPGAPLSIEATEGNFNYLRAAVASQISPGDGVHNDGDVAPAPNSSLEAWFDEGPHGQQEVPAAGPGISYVASRQAYRVRFKTNGQVKWKDFRSASLEAHDLLQGSQKAKAFQLTVS